MKASAVLTLTALMGAAFAQVPESGSPAGTSSTTRMANMAVMKGMDVLKTGKKVSLSVDNRIVAFAPQIMGKMVYVPIRFFTETGQQVIWDKSDRRATLRDQNGPTKNSVEYDASVSQKNRQPGPSMRPMYQKGTLYVPLASGLASFGLYAEWVPASNRINIRTSRPRG